MSDQASIRFQCLKILEQIIAAAGRHCMELSELNTFEPRKPTKSFFIIDQIKDSKVPL